MIDTTSGFVGRTEELNAIRSALSRGSRLVVVSGVGGIGKTTLVAAFLSLEGTQSVRRVNTYETQDPDYDFAVFLDTMDRQTSPPQFIVIDGGERLRGDLLRDGTADILSRYPSTRVFVTSRIAHDLTGATHIRLSGLRLEESADILAQSPELSREDAIAFAQSLDNHPLALHLLLGLARTHSSGELRKVLDTNQQSTIGAKFFSNLLTASGVPLEAHQDFAPEVRKEIIVVQDTLLTDLKRRPEDLHRLSPRQFEVVVAEILRDRGFQVQLTNQTRDGGKDIIASLNSELGELLILVEAKKYHPDRPIGVELVRNLYGVICDAQANSGVLITTSYFTRDAHEFRNRHNYQLQLRDFKDLVRWIQDYGARRQ